MCLDIYMHKIGIISALYESTIRKIITSAGITVKYRAKIIKFNDFVRSSLGILILILE